MIGKIILQGAVLKNLELNTLSYPPWTTDTAQQAKCLHRSLILRFEPWNPHEGESGEPAPRNYALTCHTWSTHHTHAV